MPSSRSVTLALRLVPAAVLLAATAVADRVGASDAAFYVLLAGIPASGASALAAFGRLVDLANDGRPRALARLETVLAAILLAAFVVGAAARSPVSLVTGASGLAKLALLLGLSAVVLQALASLAPRPR